MRFKDCPKCRSAVRFDRKRCDCGHKFTKKQMKNLYEGEKTPVEKFIKVLLWTPIVLIGAGVGGSLGIVCSLVIWNAISSIGQIGLPGAILVGAVIISTAILKTKKRT